MPVACLWLDDGTFAAGLDVVGVPVGDNRYVTRGLDDKAVESMSKIDAIAQKLRRDRHLQSLHAVIVYCLAPVLQYWVQPCYPEHVSAAAGRVDDSLRRAADACYGSAVIQDEMAMRRPRLPART